MEKDIRKLLSQYKLYFKRKRKKFLIPLIIFKVVKVGIVVAITLSSSECNSQTKYWVFFKDKAGATFDPYEYFDKAAIERRVQAGVNICDSSDFPVNALYVNILKDAGFKIRTESRWLNAVSLQISDNQINILKSFSFVSRVQTIESFAKPSRYTDSKMKDEDIDLLKQQIESLQGNEFISRNINGKGVRIAIFDGGFPGADKLSYFEHLRNDKRIVKTYDFVRQKEDVYGHIAHGTMTFSCVAGIADSLHIGLATGAEFLLARTETWTEFYSEEENWLTAAEWADKNGARIISSSLGYVYHRYHQKDMNGHTSLVSKAAAMATRKGILVVSSMGNDAMDFWQVLCTPADADSVLSVGGIDPETGYHINFSSFGPTADMRLKPNVCAFGKTVASGKAKLKVVQGTSFATPLVAGFAACIMQMHPDWTNMQVKKAIEESASLYPYFDYAHGYGVPRARYFTDSIAKPDTTFDVLADEISVKVKIREAFLPDSSDSTNQFYFYYNISGINGVIRKYYVVNVSENEVATIALGTLREKEFFRFHYKGFTKDFYLGKKE